MAIDSMGGPYERAGPFIVSKTGLVLMDSNLAEWLTP